MEQEIAKTRIDSRIMALQDEDPDYWGQYTNNAYIIKPPRQYFKYYRVVYKINAIAIAIKHNAGNIS